MLRPAVAATNWARAEINGLDMREGGPVFGVGLLRSRPGPRCQSACPGEGRQRRPRATLSDRLKATEIRAKNGLNHRQAIRFSHIWDLRAAVAWGLLAPASRTIHCKIGWPDGYVTYCTACWNDSRPVRVGIRGG